MRRVSELMRDQKERPLDRAVYWIEYVIRHHGAQHLRSPSLRLHICQRGLADIALTAFVSVLALVYVIIRVVNSIKKSNFPSCTAVDDARTRTKQD
jgi:glucuronosyltransferase